MRRACAGAALPLLFASQVYAQEATPEPPAPKAETIAVRLAPEWGYRRFVDSEPSTTDKRYAAPGIFALNARVDVYPFTDRPDALGRLGFFGSYARALGLKSVDIDTIPPSEVGTTFYRFDIGAEYRLPPSGLLSPTLFAGFERWVFDFDDPAPVPLREVPTARYSLLKAGGSARLHFGPLALLGDGELMLPVSVAPLGDRDPTGGFGVRGKLGVAYELWPMLIIDLSSTYTMLTFGLPSVPGRSDEPGRVFDQYFVASLGVTVRQ